MARQRYDMASKWLLHEQGKGVLQVGGLKNVRHVEPMPGEIVQSRKYPDGLLRVFLGGEKKPHHVIVEIATYPEKRALKQALDDLALAYSVLGHLPDLLMLVLCRKGNLHISGEYEVGGTLGMSNLIGKWKPVELWTLPAVEYLEKAGPAVTPWITLMKFDGPAEVLLQRCADKIEREALPQERADLLAVSEVLTRLRFPDPELLRLFGGEKAMIESPLLQEFVAKRLHDAIEGFLKGRFGSVPRDVARLLRDVVDERKLNRLSVIAGKCADMDAFREALLK
jgi:hypothetical protein